jgi:hypothetical protein
MKPKTLHSKTEREIARYVRDGQWAFMERIQAVGKLWFCVWNKDGYHAKPYPPNLWVCCLMTGMDYLDRSSARWGRDSLCPSGAAFVSTDSAAPSGLPEVGR